jgi:hypothetical protein
LQAGSTALNQAAQHHEHHECESRRGRGKRNTLAT